MTPREAFISLYARDVRENPDAYDSAVVADPETHGERIINGLTDGECARMVRDLRRERARIAKLTR